VIAFGRRSSVSSIGTTTTCITPITFGIPPVLQVIGKIDPLWARPTTKLVGTLVFVVGGLEKWTKSMPWDILRCSPRRPFLLIFKLAKKFVAKWGYYPFDNWPIS
jgi:hypothetical protein